MRERWDHRPHDSRHGPEDAGRGTGGGGAPRKLVETAQTGPPRGNDQGLARELYDSRIHDRHARPDRRIREQEFRVWGVRPVNDEIMLQEDALHVDRLERDGTRGEVDG